MDQDRYSGVRDARRGGRTVGKLGARKLGIRSRALAVVCAVAAGLGAGAFVLAPNASANTSTATDVPYTCTTNGFGNQLATYSATITDTIDPAAVGDSVTYRFVAPFAQDPPPVTATYKGGTVTYPIPTGLNVTSVSTPPKAGSNLTATVAVQGPNIVVTTTGSQPIDGASHPTPDLLVTGTITAAAAGPGVVWKTPSSIVANVDAQVGPTTVHVVATCAPDVPNTTIATTTVPAGPEAPQPVNQTVSVISGATKAITLSATDSNDPPASLTYSVATQPSHGTLTGTAPALSYTGTQGYVGPDSFTFTATDPGGLTGTGTITLKVLARNVIDNTPPVISITSPKNGAVLKPGQVVNAAFTCSDAITGVDACTGTVASGAPISATVGVHSFVVVARDAAGNIARATVGYRVVETALVVQNYNAANAVPVTCNPQLPQGIQTVPITVSAPLQVGTARSLTFRFAPRAGSVPLLRTRTNIVYTFAAPVNGTAVSATIVPNTGTANARASASATVTGGKAILTVAGPIAGGNTAATAYTPPSVNVVITAASTPNVDVQTKLASYQQTDTVSGVGQVPVTVTCTGGKTAVGQPNPVLTKTRIIDTTPPTISLTSPLNGALFGVNAAVVAHFSCADGTSLATCTGTTPAGSNLATNTPGIKTLGVTAVDAAGNVAQKLVSVRVVVTSFTTRFENDQLPLLDAVAEFYGTDRTGVARKAAQIVGYVFSLRGLPDDPIPVPVNTGPVAVSPVYTPADAQKLAATANAVGLTGGEFQKFGVNVLIYYYSVSH